MSKFFVFAASGWSELDVSSGRVEGWREPARFVYMRRGRLQVARAAVVLRELRALAAGQDSAVRDGLPVSRRSYPENAGRRYDPQSGRVHHHCCCSRTGHSQQGCGSENQQIEDGLKNRQIVVTLNSDMKQGAADNREQRLQVTAENNNININIVSPVKQVLTYNIKESAGVTDKRDINNDNAQVMVESDDELQVLGSAPVRARSRSGTVSPLVFPNPRPRRKLYNAKEQLNKIAEKVSNGKHSSESSSSSSEVGSPRTRRRSKRLKPDTSDEESVSGDEAPTSQACKELVIDDEDVKLFRRYLQNNDSGVDLDRFDNDTQYKTSVFFKINPLVSIGRSKKIDEMMRAQRESSQKNEDNMSLKEFAHMLGLTGEKVVVPRYRTRTSCGARSTTQHIVSSTSDTDTDKENFVRRAPRTRRSVEAHNSPHTHTQPLRSSPRNMRAGIKEGDSKPAKNKDGDIQQLIEKMINNKSNETTVAKPKEVRKSLQRAAKSPMKALEVSEAEEDEVLSHIRRDRERRQQLRQQLIQQKQQARQLVRAPDNVGEEGSRLPREFSPLEDQVLVAWVSVEQRARLVKGNQVWRQLEPRYVSLAGRRRSWQALRNRYLRHVLPRLHTLALPHHQQEQLRAAAAAGCLPSRARAAHPPRRNSLYRADTARSASARARR